MLCLSKKVSLVGCFEYVFLQKIHSNFPFFCLQLISKPQKFSGASPLDPANAICIASRNGASPHYVTWNFLWYEKISETLKFECPKTYVLSLMSTIGLNLLEV